MHRAFYIVIISLAAMNILEFQSKRLCEQFGIPVPKSVLLNNIHPILNESINLTFPIVLKAQVPSKKRARRGGICLARTWEEARSMATEMFASKIDNITVDHILAEELIDFQSGFYISFYYDMRDLSIILTAGHSFSTLEENGGHFDHVENEVKVTVDPFIGILNSTTGDICSFLEIEREKWQLFDTLIRKLWRFFEKFELQRLDINPIVFSNSQLFVLGVDVEADIRAMYRHPEIENFIDFGFSQGLQQKLNKLDCDYSEFEGKVCIISSCLEMSAAIRDLIKSNDLDASLLIGMNGNIFPERIQHVLGTVEKNSSSECVIIHCFCDESKYKSVLEGIRLYSQGSNKPLPIFLRMPGFDIDKGSTGSDLNTFGFLRSLDKAQDAINIFLNEKSK